MHDKISLFFYPSLSLTTSSFMTHVDVYTMANMYTVSCGISFFFLFPIFFVKMNRFL
jgi:hypothetical protein